jgi:hypothetical protein
MQQLRAFRVAALTDRFSQRRQAKLSGAARATAPVASPVLGFLALDSTASEGSGPAGRLVPCPTADRVTGRKPVSELENADASDAAADPDAEPEPEPEAGPVPAPEPASCRADAECIELETDALCSDADAATADPDAEPELKPVPEPASAPCRADAEPEEFETDALCSRRLQLLSSRRRY